MSQLRYPNPMAKVLNLTPHDLTVIYDDDDPASRLIIPASGTVARAITGNQQSRRKIMATATGLPVRSPPAYASVQGLPEDITLNILVSHITGVAMRELDIMWKGLVLVPDTGPGSVVRNDGGQIVGVRYVYPVSGDVGNVQAVEKK